LPQRDDIISLPRQVRKVPIVLQKSQNALRLVFRQKTKQATIADRCVLKRATDEFIAIDVVPHMIIRSPRLEAGKFVFWRRKKSFATPSAKGRHHRCKQLESKEAAK